MASGRRGCDKTCSTLFYTQEKSRETKKQKEIAVTSEPFKHAHVSSRSFNNYLYILDESAKQGTMIRS